MPYSVGLNIFVAPNANYNNRRINDMFIGAANFWSQYGINLTWLWHGPYTQLNPQWYWWVFTNENYDSNNIQCGVDYTQQPTVQNLFSYNQFTNWIGVFFVGGDFLGDVNPQTGMRNSNGCTQYVRFTDANGNLTDFQPNIVLTNQASPLILAHEIGHALFARISGNSIVSKDPCCPNDPGGHSTDPNSLMYFSVPANPGPLTPAEIQQAQSSPKAFFYQ